jgi:hypothetical protein
MGIGTAIGIGGIASAGIGAAASAGAAGTQANAAENAQQLQAQEAQNALNFQEQQWNTQQQNLAPWLTQGQGAINTLAGLVPGMNAAEAAYPNFQAPTAAQAAATPGYQFTAQQGEQAVQNSAAARGGLLSGNTLAAEQQYGQGLASTTYQQTYNNALNQYQQAYNQFQNTQANQFNRYASLAGVGQTAANTLGQQGQAAAQNAGNIALTSGAQQGQDIQNAAAAQASGYVGAANAATGGINSISQYLLLQNLGLLGVPAASTPYSQNPASTNTIPGL